MVEVEYLSKQEREDGERLENLVAIAKEVIPDMEIFQFALMVNFQNKEGSIPIIATLALGDSNHINVDVYSDNRFDTAMKFAEVYEARTKEKVVIKRNYD